jgi:hypothetical protein
MAHLIEMRLERSVLCLEHYSRFCHRLSSSTSPSLRVPNAVDCARLTPISTAWLICVHA